MIYEGKEKPHTQARCDDDVAGTVAQQILVNALERSGGRWDVRTGCGSLYVVFQITLGSLGDKMRGGALGG